MGTLIQIRDVPEEVHRVFKARAAASGTSMSEYLRRTLERAASRPTADELSARIHARGHVRLGQPSQDIIGDMREHGE